jgi:hypothetical protein
MAEITEAKERGYSWTQVNKAVMEDATEKGEWNTDWDSWRVEALYRELAKEETA